MSLALGLPEYIVNVEGGAVAHGHPIGATGAVLTTKLIHSMCRDRLTRGLVTLCIEAARASRWRLRCSTEVGGMVIRVCCDATIRGKPLKSGGQL